MASLLFPKWTQFELSTGAPAASYWLHFLTTGTSTAKDAYSDVDATTPIANPYQLNSAGRPADNIFISGKYRVVLHSTNNLLTGSSIADVDPVEDGVRASAFQSATPTYDATNSGTANAIVFAYVPAITTYTDGQPLRGRIAADNTGAVTINAGGGVKSLVKRDGRALRAGDLQGPDIIEYYFDSTTDVFRLGNPCGPNIRTDVAPAAGVVDLTGYRYARITGTAAVTGITIPDGEECEVLFADALTLTNGASLILQGGADIQTAAGDSAKVFGEASSVARVVDYARTVRPAFGTVAVSAAQVTAPADTNENALATISVPAKLMGTRGTLLVTYILSCTNSANAKTIRTRFSAIGGTAFDTTDAISQTGITRKVFIANRAATNSQLGGTDVSQTSPTLVTAAIDTTVATTLVISAQKATAGDTITLEYYRVDLLL